jgi:hypothetical protein
VTKEGTAKKSKDKIDQEILILRELLRETKDLKSQVTTLATQVTNLNAVLSSAPSSMNYVQVMNALQRMIYQMNNFASRLLNIEHAIIRMVKIWGKRLEIMQKATAMKS